MIIRMTLRQKLKQLSGNTPCVINFGTYTKSGRPYELLESLSEEELDSKYLGNTYTVYATGTREMKIRVS